MARKPAEDRKAEIISATLRLADELGPDRLTTLAVAQAVGLTQPGVFRHFRTKQDLWHAVALHIAEKLTGGWQEVLATTTTPDARLTAYLRVQLHHIAANPAIPAILHSRELATENAPLREVFMGLMAEFQALLVAELEAGERQSVFRPGLVPKDAAILLIALIQGLAIRWALGQRAFALEEEGARLLECQIDLFRTRTAMEKTI